MFKLDPEAGRHVIYLPQTLKKVDNSVHKHCRMLRQRFLSHFVRRGLMENPFFFRKALSFLNLSNTLMRLSHANQHVKPMQILMILENGGTCIRQRLLGAMFFIMLSCVLR